MEKITDKDKFAKYILDELMKQYAHQNNLSIEYEVKKRTDKPDKSA